LGSRFGDFLPPPSYDNCFSLEIDGPTNTLTLASYGSDSTATIELIDSYFTVSLYPILTATTFDFYCHVEYQYFPGESTTIGVSSADPSFSFPYNWGLYDEIDALSLNYVNAFNVENSGTNISDAVSTIVSPDLTFTPFGAFSFKFNALTAPAEGSYPATSGVAWELIQDICSANNIELLNQGDSYDGVADVIICNIGRSDLSLDNAVGSPTVTPSAVLVGREVEVSYYNSEIVKGVVYDAEANGNNIISVNAGETTVTSVKWNVDPITLRQPQHVTTFPIQAGEYFVIDAAGVTLSAGEWEEYGGSVTVQIDDADPSAIQITMVGPYTDTTLAGGPYELAASDGDNKYATLKIDGLGVNSAGGQLSLITAVDTSKSSRLTTTRIDNRFVRGIEQAYDRGVWASLKASGPDISLRATIPTADTYGPNAWYDFEIPISTAGALVDYEHSKYRVSSTSMSNISTALTCDWYVTVDDFDFAYQDYDVSEHDAFWDVYECQDQVIMPFKGL
jgi:hypothetical protein